MCLTLRSVGRKNYFTLNLVNKAVNTALLLPAIRDKRFGTKWRNLVKLDNVIWYLFLHAF